MNPVIGYTLGKLSFVIGFAMMLTALADIIFHVGVIQTEAASFRGAASVSFFISSLLALFVGGLLYFTFQRVSKTLRPVDIFITAAMGAVFLPALACLPFFLSGVSVHFVDAYFEAVSGLTTTGATLLSQLDTLPAPILLWRSLLQWLGGLAFLFFVTSVLSYYGIGGMGLFKSHSIKDQKTVQRLMEFFKSIIWVYAGLTFICFISYLLSGMSNFDALNHAMTTISTGGFSTHDAAFGFYESNAPAFVASIYMLLSALPFILFVQFFGSQKLNFFQDEQVKAFVKLVCFAVILLLAWQISASRGIPDDALFSTFFAVINTVSTTGYNMDAENVWGGFGLGVLFFVMLVGGCAGSTAGGMKVFRLSILMRALGYQIQKLVYPAGVFDFNYVGQPIKQTVLVSVIAFVIIYVLMIALFTLCLAASTGNFMESLQNSVAALANTGFSTDYLMKEGANIDQLSKLILAAAMIFGRFEILIFLTLCIPSLWKR